MTRFLAKGAAAWLACLASVAAPGAGFAQAVQQRIQSEARVEVLVSERTAVHAGYGVSVPVGLYLRGGLVVGTGVGSQGFDARTDLIGRFSFDPLRQSRWASYGGGGVSARFNSTADRGVKGYLLCFVGVEGPLPFGRPRGWVPAFELGLGGGARFAVIVRRGSRARR